MTDIRTTRICPCCGKNIYVPQPPCLTCAFFDVDFKKCRVIRTDENLQVLLRFLSQKHN